MPVCWVMQSRSEKKSWSAIECRQNSREKGGEAVRKEYAVNHPRRSWSPALPEVFVDTRPIRNAASNVMSVTSLSSELSAWSAATASFSCCSCFSCFSCFDLCAPPLSWVMVSSMSSGWTAVLFSRSWLSFRGVTPVIKPPFFNERRCSAPLEPCEWMDEGGRGDVSVRLPPWLSASCCEFITWLKYLRSGGRLPAVMPTQHSTLVCVSSDVYRSRCQRVKPLTQSISLDTASPTSSHFLLQKSKCSRAWRWKQRKPWCYGKLFIQEAFLKAKLTKFLDSYC